MMLRTRAVLVLAAVLVASDAARADGLAGGILGRVTDAAGAPLAAVQVTLEAPALPQPRRAATAASGRYRLVGVPAGTCTLTFDLPGFRRVAFTATVQAGSRARIDARLEPLGPPGSLASARATNASGADALPDPTSTSAATHVPREWLDRLPRRPDLQAAALATPGVAVSPDDVGGNTAGRDTIWLSGGTAAQAWTLDGRPIIERQGNSPEDGPAPGYGIDAVEAFRLRTAGVDVLAQGSGLRIDIVTRSGSNQFRATGRYGLAHARLQADNVTADLRSQGAGWGNPIRQLTDIGLEAGFPLRRGRAWLFAAASRSKTDVGVIGFYRPACIGEDGAPVAGARWRADCMRPDITVESNLAAKAQVAWTPASTTTFRWARAGKSNATRGAGPGNPIETTSRQHDAGMAQPASVDHEWAVSDRLVLDIAATVFDSRTILDFHEDGLAGVQPAYDVYTGTHWRSGERRETFRPSADLALTGSRFVSGSAGGDHSIEFGIDWLVTPLRTSERTGGGAVACFTSSRGRLAPYQAWLYRDGRTAIDRRRWSAWAQDSYTLGRLTVSGGLRLDRQDDRARAAGTPANIVAPDLLPAMTFNGADSGVVFTDLSPRMGVAWDVTGSGRTVITSTAARSFGAGIDTARLLQPTRQTSLAHWWNDANGDRFVQRQEIDVGRGPAAAPSSNYDPADPALVTTATTVDPGLGNDITDEVTVGIERQVMRHLVIGARYVSRTSHRTRAIYPINDDGSPVASGTYRAVAWMPPAATCPAGASCPVVTYHQRDEPLPAGAILRNDGRRTTHHSLEITAERRLARGWALALACTWNRAARFYPRATRDYTDPTNIALLDGAEYSPVGSGWVAKLTGSAALPWRFATSWSWNCRQGHPFARTVRTPARPSQGAASVYLRRYGDERYPNVSMLDCRVERPFAAGPLRVVPSLSVFNLQNAGTVLERVARQNTPTANDVVGILAPRIGRIDLRLSW